MALGAVIKSRIAVMKRSDEKQVPLFFEINYENRPRVGLNNNIFPPPPVSGN